MLLEILTAAARLVPFHENTRPTARAAMTRDRNVTGIPDFATLQVDTQAQVGVFHVKKELVVHSAIETSARNHHEGTADDGDPRRSSRGASSKDTGA